MLCCHVLLWGICCCNEDDNNDGNDGGGACMHACMHACNRSTAFNGAVVGFLEVKIRFDSTWHVLWLLLLLLLLIQYLRKSTVVASVLHLLSSIFNEISYSRSCCLLLLRLRCVVLRCVMYVCMYVSLTHSVTHILLFFNVLGYNKWNGSNHIFIKDT